MMAIRSQYPMSNLQSPIIKSEPMDRFPRGGNIFSIGWKSREIFFHWVEKIGLFFHRVENSSQPDNPVLPGYSLDDWTLNIGYWILNPSFPLARGPAAAKALADKRAGSSLPSEL